ncbi:DUF1887 family CARF protein [Clostridium sp.]|uniref:Card1-like endonuclease domain-containing protein n=1 Tax=Clostridium sp. TaxID=1506 RepID=UPI00260D215C|nr:DUF1887 family CARF protein [Clostridium sp.]
MNIEVLINQLGEHNESNILATKNLKPKKVIFIYEDKDKSLCENIKKYYLENFKDMIFEGIKINEGEIDKIIDLINIYKDKETIVNLTCGNKLITIVLATISRKNQLKSIFIDMKRKQSYLIGEDINNLELDYEDMILDEIVKASGGEIIDDSSILGEKEDLKYLTKKIYENLTLWHKYKQKLYDGNIFTHDYEDSTKVNINTNFLEKDERDLLNKILVKLKDLNGINYIKDKENQIKVNFNNRYLKSFIFKSGTWLEIATNIMISELKEVDEVKSGVIFLWNDKNKDVKNEVDVLAVKDSIVICISCKDSNKYNEDTLNELDVYSSQLGGDKVFKILVATKEPLKALVKLRAKEMGINIVIFDGNEDKFKDTIRNIILVKK